MQQSIKKLARHWAAPGAWLRTLAVTAALLAAGAAPAQTITLDFDSRPALPPGPNVFDLAGPMQTYSEAGLYSISGGVVLGFPSFLPAFFPHGSGLNLYGTSDLGDASLLDTITLALPLAGVTSVSGVLFNGQPIMETYNVSFFTGANGQSLLGTQTFTDIAGASSTDAFANFSFTSSLANPITRVTINTPNGGTNGWDFFVDTVVISAIPEPSQATMAAAGLLALVLLRRRQQRRGS